MVAVFGIYNKHTDIFVKITDIPDDYAKRQCILINDGKLCPLHRYLSRNYPEFNINWLNGEANTFEYDENIDDFIIDITVTFDEIINNYQYNY